MINWEIWIWLNYKIIKVKDKILWKIMEEKLRFHRWHFIKEQGWLLDVYKSVACNILCSYDWKYNDEIEIKEYHNKIPNILLYEMALLISGTTITPTLKANYIAIWDDNTTPASWDTALWNELLRWTFTNRYSADNVAYLDKFFDSSEVWWDTYLEAWIFVDWTASADSWYLLSRVLINETVAASENLTCNCTITLSSAT